MVKNNNSKGSVLDLDEPSPSYLNSLSTLIPNSIFGTNLRIPKRKCYKGSTSSKVLPVNDIHSPQTFRQETFNFKLEEHEYVYPHTSIQDVQPCHPKEVTSKGCLDVCPRYKGCVPPCTNSSSNAEIPGIQLGRETFLLSSSPIRSDLSPLRVQQIDEISADNSTEKRRKHTGLSRRLDNLGYIKNSSQGEDSNGARYFNVTRIHHPRRKVYPGTHAGSSLVGSKMARAYSQDGTSPRIPEEVARHGSSDVGSISNDQETARVSPRTDCIRCPGFTRREASCTPNSLVSCQNQQEGDKQGYSFQSTRRSTNNPEMVVRQEESIDSAGHRSKNTGLTSLDRRVRNRVWLLLERRRKCKRRLELRRRRVTYKRQGTFGGYCSNRIKFSSRREDNRGGNRQYHNLLLHSQSGVKQIDDSTRTNRETLQSHEEKEDHTDSISPSRSIKRNSGCPVQERSITHGVGSTPVDIQPNNSRVGDSSSGGRDGNTTEYEVEELHLPIQPSISSTNGLLHGRSQPLVSDLYLSPDEASFEGFSPPQELQRASIIDSTSQYSPTLVLGNDKESQEEMGATSFRTATTPRHGASVYQQLLGLSRVDFLKERYTQSHDKQMAERLIAAYRSSTRRQHEIAWKEFKKWLISKNYPDITETTVLHFLDFLFEEKSLASNTILGYRNSLKLPLKEGFNINVISEDFSLLAKAQFLEKPKQPKQSPQWPLETVLNGLTSIDASSCDIESLFKKTLFLTALASGNRASELSAIRRDSINFLPGNKGVIMSVRPGFLYKNQRMDRTPPNITFPALEDFPPLCPVKCLKLYLERTEPVDRNPSLFLNPITNSNIQRPVLSLWLCRTIKEFCPESIPKAHDVRKQAASLAWVKGIPPNQIVEAAFWSSSSVFVDRYLNNQVSTNVPCVALRNSC